MQINKGTLYLVSNMYPSKKHIRYGIFVKNFEKAVENDFYVKKSILTKRTNPFSKLLGYIQLYFEIFTLIFKVGKNDVIYVHFPLHMAPILRFVRFFNKRIILNFHGSDLIFDSVFTKALSLFLNPLVKRSFIVVPSNYYKNKLIDLYAINPNLVFVYPSGGINTDIFYPQKTKYKDTFVLGFVSNFIESKGWKLLLLAIEGIIKNNSIPNIELIMIGEGPDEQEIINWLKKINIKHSVISSVSQEQLAVMYNTFSLFIFPTYRESESLGLVGLESMACGTPVIAGKVGGPMGYIKDGINSYLFEKKDKDDLEKKIIQYYSLSDEQKEIIRTNGIDTAQLYDCKIVNKDLLSFLKNLS